MINGEPIWLVDVEHPEDGCSGGCVDCGRADGEDDDGRYLLQFYVGEESGEVWCPACGLRAVNEPMVPGVSRLKARFLVERVLLKVQGGQGFHNALAMVVEAEYRRG